MSEANDVTVYLDEHAERIRQFLAIARQAGYDPEPGYEALDALVARAEQDEAKVEAYDKARATVKIEGHTRAYYVLRAEQAERDNELLRNGCEQANLLLERDRFKDDPEAKVVRAVLRAALAATGGEAAIREWKDGRS